MAQPVLPSSFMRVFFVIAVLAGLTWVFVVQKQQPQAKAVPTPKTAVAGTSPRPASEHNWMKSALDRTNEVKRQVAQQRNGDPNK